MDLAILKEPLHLLEYTPKVIALENIVTSETIPLKILDQVLSGVSIITGHEWQELILLHHFHNPVITIVIVHKVIPRGSKKPTLEVYVIRNSVTLYGLIYSLCR